MQQNLKFSTIKQALLEKIHKQPGLPFTSKDLARDLPYSLKTISSALSAFFKAGILDRKPKKTRHGYLYLLAEKLTEQIAEPAAHAEPAATLQQQIEQAEAEVAQLQAQLEQLQQLQQLQAQKQILQKKIKDHLKTC